MDKFGRNYSLSVQSQSGEIVTITLPFTVEFDVFRNTYGSANIATIRVFNLSERTRLKILKDQFDTGNLKTIDFQAGYGRNLSTVLNGNITKSWSARDGVNFISEIDCFDGGFAFANAFVNQQFPAGTTQQTVVTTLAQSLSQFGVKVGPIGNFPGTIPRGNSYKGGTTDVLRELTGGAFFIDNGIVHCLGDDEVTEGEIQVVSSASGLLGTPIREQQFLNFDMLFEPRLKLGQRLRLESITGANFNGEYKVVSLRHKGTISDAVGGSAITTIGVLAGTFSSVTALTAAGV